MSDADIEIRNAIADLQAGGGPVTVADVQERLKQSPFFQAKGIELVPAEWIEPILTEPGGPWPDLAGELGS